MNFRETASKGVLWGSVLMTAAATRKQFLPDKRRWESAHGLTGGAGTADQEISGDRTDPVLHDMGGC